MVDSDGITTSLFPVNAAPAVPAPAPIRPPISAPLPPPASPPIRAPPPAPPPMNPAVRLPLPDCSFSYSATLTGFPEIEVTWIPNAPDPLNLPCPLAATTVPTTCAPRGKMTVPPAPLTDCANTPVNPSPTLFLLALNSWVIVTTTAVPAGAVTSTGGGGGGGGAGAAATGAGAGVIAGAAAGAAPDAT